jgi:arylsulfatase A-like enzyme
MRILRPVIDAGGKRRGWAALAAPGLAVAVLAAGCSGWDSTPYRHVVLISLDTTRADHLGCYGSPRVKTPHIDGIAREGSLFEQATAAAPSTLASHTSLLTGLAPRSHGVARNGPSMAEMLGEAGFHAAGFASAFALDSVFGLARGFDHWDEEFELLSGDRAAGVDQSQRRAQTVTDAVLDYLDGLEVDRLFLFVHYFDPHVPYDPPPPYDRMYARPGGLARASLHDVNQSLALHYHELGLRPRTYGELFREGLSREVVVRADGEPAGRDEDLAALYAGEISYLDEHLGRLLDGLEAHGILRESLLVLAADHGESFWEHGDFWNHGLWVYETGVRVPLIFRLADGRGAGRRISRPVSTLDVLPTVLELLGLPRPPQLEGQSLARALDGERPRNKLIRAPYLGVEELFDVLADPGETENLLRDPTPEVLRIRDELRAELAAWEATRLPHPSEFLGDEDAEVVDQLRALGYAVE